VLYRSLQGLDFLHSRKIIHRDIKSDNLLYNMAGEVKLGDFGFAVQLTKQKTSLKDLMGTPEYMAPELINEEGYGTGVDIWSFGIFCMELANGELPYVDIEDPKEVLTHLKKGPPKLEDKKWSPAFKDFVSKCLVIDPLKRHTAKQLLIHEFLIGA